jgi:glycosyltransferase involved in cell wall biosynthesis
MMMMMMMMKPAVSIIVPIYNVENYLSRCIDSLLCQTLENIEIILIDDGSTDQSGRYADEYSERDARIQVIHKENGGLSSARNAGLEVARGEYVGFVDSDDWVKNNMFEKLYNAAVHYRSGVAMAGFYRVNETGETEENLTILNQLCYEDNQVIDDILIPMIGSDSQAKDDISIHMCVWKNIYQREVLEKNQIRFLSERQYISEDIIFNIDVFTKIKRASIVNSSLYYYSINIQSLTQVYKSDRYEKECILYEYLKYKLREVGLLEKSDVRLKRAFIGRLRNCIIKEARDNKRQSVINRIQNIRKITMSPLLIEAFEKYPISNYSLKLRVVSYFMKYHLAMLLFLVSVFRKRI